PEVIRNIYRVKNDGHIKIGKKDNGTHIHKKI
ncbi:unnamed protein product, partial [marine sediment metagenome]